MPTLKRTGVANRLIVRNSKVYASTLAPKGDINGLFAYRREESRLRLRGPGAPLMPFCQTMEGDEEGKDDEGVAKCARAPNISLRTSVHGTPA